MICAVFMADLDLNLLRTFDALMEHRSVTRAATHLRLTQPAVSHALARLRKALDDVLFIRTQSGLQPTARAEEMASDIRRGLFHFQNALAPTSFDPATAERHFTIAASSYFCTLLIPALVERLREEAPGISLGLVPARETLVTLLDRGEIDLALGTSFDGPARIIVEPLYQEKMVWIASSDNAVVRKRLRADEIHAADSILVVPSRPFEMAAKTDRDSTLAVHHAVPSAAASGSNRFIVYDSQTAVSLVARSDLIAVVPERMAAWAVARGRVVILDWMTEESSYEMALIWHVRGRSNHGLTWLRERIHRAVNSHQEQIPAGLRRTAAGD